MDNDFHMAHIYLSQISVVGRGGGTECIFYCKRAILFLSSSKILTPHPPLRPASVAGGGQTRRAERGMGVNILEDERNRIALLQ